MPSANESLKVQTVVSPPWMVRLSTPVAVVVPVEPPLNVHDAAMRLVEGSCDVLIAYHHASQPLQLDADRYEMLTLGRETLAPYCRPDDKGEPMFRLPGRPSHPLPYLGYAPGAYLGQVTDLLLKQSGTAIHLDRVYETDMADGLKVMALEGHGIAFLPHSAVQKEVRSRKLVSAAPAGLQELRMVMDVRAYREKPTRKEPAKGQAQALWEYLQSHGDNGQV